MTTSRDLIINIRSLLPQDIEWIIQRHKDLYNIEYGFDSTFADYVRDPLYRFHKGFDKEKENMWVAEVDNNPVGMIAIAKVDDKIAQLRWFLIDPEARGLGLGHKLLSTAVNFCKEKDYKQIFLGTVSILEAARHLYERYGFTLTESNTHEIWGNKLTEERWDLFMEEAN